MARTRCCGHGYINGPVYVHGYVAKSLQQVQLICQLLKIVIYSASTTDINKAIKHEQRIKSHDYSKKRLASTQQAKAKNMK